MEQPPPITFIAPDNLELERFRNAGSKITVVEKDKKITTKQLDIEVLGVSQDPLVECRPGHKNYRWKTYVVDDPAKSIAEPAGKPVDMMGRKPVSFVIPL